MASPQRKAALLSSRLMPTQAWRQSSLQGASRRGAFEFENWQGRDGNDPSVDIAKDRRCRRRLLDVPYQLGSAASTKRSAPSASSTS